MRNILLTVPFIFASCASLFPNTSQPVAVTAAPPVQEIDQVSEITNEIAAVVSTFTLDKESSIISDPDFNDKNNRKTLSYTFKKSNKSRIIEVVIKIVPVKKRIHYSLVIQMVSHGDSSVVKKIELKTTIADELITQARNLLATF